MSSVSISRILSPPKRGIAISLDLTLLPGSSSHTGLHQVEFTTILPSLAAESRSATSKRYLSFNVTHHDTFHL